MSTELLHVKDDVAFVFFQGYPGPWAVTAMDGYVDFPMSDKNHVDQVRLVLKITFEKKVISKKKRYFSSSEDR